MVDTTDNNEMDDQTLDRILGLATAPDLSSGFENRVMAELDLQKGTSAKIIAFPKRKSPSLWLMGVPLAACLVLGVFLGASGQFSDVLPGASSATVTASAEPLSPSGVDEVENLSAGDLS